MEENQEKRLSGWDRGKYQYNIKINFRRIWRLTVEKGSTVRDRAVGISCPTDCQLAKEIMCHEPAQSLFPIPFFYVRNRKSAETSVKLSHGVHSFIKHENVNFIVPAARTSSPTWLRLTQDRYQRRTLVNKIMNFWVPLNATTLLVK
jgi:hypothetical protein